MTFVHPSKNPNSDYRNYFKDKIFTTDIKWHGKNISERFKDTNHEPPFDSGVICVESVPCDEGDSIIRKLECFPAPYHLMSATIRSDGPDSCRTFPDEPLDKSFLSAKKDIAVGIGIVLSIIANKGTAEKNNRVPYLLLVKRKNAEIRSNQLDAAVVEGLQFNDFFTQDNYEIKGVDGLNRIAKRALEEERGINCDLLTHLGLLQMPKEYYLGYDEEYFQWNFFGTVIIDCTVEEIIRQGCYYTKDKFETQEIYGWPTDPRDLFYHLYHVIYDTHQSGTSADGKKLDSSPQIEGMWATGWASVAFALKDTSAQDNGKQSESYSIPPKARFILIPPHKKDTDRTTIKAKLNRNRNRSSTPYTFLNFLMNTIFDWAAEFGTKHNRPICTASFVLSLFMFVLTILWIFVPAITFLSVCVTGLSSLIALLTCWVVVAITYSKRLKGRDFFRFTTYWDPNNDYDCFQETSVFRGVKLLDGNIARKHREVTFSYKPGTKAMHYFFRVTRDCKLFDDNKKSPTLWTITDSSISSNFENNNWQIQCSEEEHAKTFRVVIPIVTQDNQIVFVKNDHDQLSHPVDFTVSYSSVKHTGPDYDEFLKNELNKRANDTILKMKLNAQIPDHCTSSSEHGKSISDISYRFLLESEGQNVIVGFTRLNSDLLKAGDSLIAYSLSSNLSSALFANNILLDDITRVACEYATGEYIGYAMSER